MKTDDQIKYTKLVWPLFPPVIYVLISYISMFNLRKYGVAGPVRFGEPLFPGYFVKLVSYSYIALMSIGVVISIYFIVRCWKYFTWEKYAVLALTVLLVPAQMFFYLTAMMYIFGK